MAKDRNKPKPTTKTPPRSAAATSGRTAERRKERERQRRRQQLITGGIAVVALAVIAVIVFLIVNAPAEAPISAESLTRYDGVQQSTTEQGYPRLGDPNSPVQVAEYSSFGCSHCRDFHDQTIDQILDRVRAGKIAFTYMPLYGYGGLTNEQGAALAAVCASQQGKFWQFHDALFNWQGLYANQAFSNNRINSGVDGLGLDRGAYNACINSGVPGDVVNAAMAQAQALLNFVGTPTITINGVVPLDENQQAIGDATGVLARIDSEVARLGVLPTVEPTAQATSEATEPAAEATPETTPAS